MDMNLRLAERITPVAVIPPQIVDDNVVSTGWVKIAALATLGNPNRLLALILTGAVNATVDAILQTSKSSNGSSPTTVKAITQIANNVPNQTITMDCRLEELGDGYHYVNLAITVGAGAVTAGVNAVQALDVVDSTGVGTFTLTTAFGTTAPITYSSTAATMVTNINAALNTLYGGAGIGPVASGATLAALILTYSGEAVAWKPQPLVVATTTVVSGSFTFTITSTTTGAPPLAGASVTAILLGGDYRYGLAQLNGAVVNQAIT